MQIDDLLGCALARQASDIHVSAGLPPLLRVQGSLQRLDAPILDDAAMMHLVGQILNEEQYLSLIHI